MLSNRATLPSGINQTACLTRSVHLFIYKVRPRVALADTDAQHHCVVLALGNNREDAEKIAINGVHQSGWHILRTDTAAVLDTQQITGDHDVAMLDDLAQFGCAVEVL